MLISPVKWYHGHIDEDILTSYIFSTLQYVPSAWHAFFQRIIELNPELKSYSWPEFDEQIIFQAWPSWEVPEDYREVFFRMQNANKRKTHGEKGGIEPDVVITGRGWRLIVESEESHDYEAVQMVQQYVVSQVENQRHGDEQVFQLLLGPTLGRPRLLSEDIQKVWKQYGNALKKCGGNLVHQLKHLYWIGWEEVAVIFETEALEMKHPENMILLNALEILKAKGYFPIPSPKDILKQIAVRPEFVQRINAWVDELIAKDKFENKTLNEIFKRKNQLQSLLFFFAKSDRLQIDCLSNNNKNLLALIDFLEKNSIERNKIL